MGLAEGASLVTGGGRPDIDPGWYVEPTVFDHVDNQMTIAREEIFGPVAVVIDYDGEDEAVALANDSEYGLAGAVWTADTDRGESLAARIRTGSVAINSPGALDAYGPFGGFKNSGFGREGGAEALAAAHRPSGRRRRAGRRLRHFGAGHAPGRRRHLRAGGYLADRPGPGAAERP